MDTVHTPELAPATPGATTRPLYMNPESRQTLREGLAEYRAANPHLFGPEVLADEALGDLGRFFAAHDACHVLFGLDTSLSDETLADTWTLCGTDVTFREIWSYFRSDAQREFFATFLRDVGYWRTLTASLTSVPRIVRVLWHSRAMKRKWALHRWADHLDVPLEELRRSYGIRLL